MADDGLAYVKEVDEKGNITHPRLKMTNTADVPAKLLDAVVESAQECPGECIYLEG